MPQTVVVRRLVQEDAQDASITGRRAEKSSRSLKEAGIRVEARLARDHSGGTQGQGHVLQRVGRSAHGVQPRSCTQVQLLGCTSTASSLPDTARSLPAGTEAV